MSNSVDCLASAALTVSITLAAACPLEAGHRGSTETAGDTISSVCETAVPQVNVAIGAGIGGTQGGTQGAAGMILTLKSKALSYSLRLIESSDVAIMGGPTDSEVDIALLMGVSSTDREGASAIVQAGLGYAAIDADNEQTVSFYDEGSLGNSDDATVGLALQGQFYFRHVGVVAFGNFNQVRSFGGVLLCIRFGNRI